MSTKPEQFSAAQQKQFDTMLNLASSAFSSAERLAELNLSTSRRMFEDFTSGSKNALGTRTPQDFYSLQSGLIQPWLEKAVSYNRSVFEIATKGQQELSKQIEAQIAEARRSFVETLDEAARSAPSGSDTTVDAMKSAVTAASDAYDTLYSTMQKMAEMAEANIAAATEATAKATEATAEATGKSAEATGKSAEATGKSAETTGKTATAQGKKTES